MAGRIAIVTGSNQGIGFWIATQLAKSGAFETTVLACRRADAAAEAAAKITEAGGSGVVSMTVDISKPQSVKDFVTAFASKYGKLDCLVNNAGMAFKSADPTPFNDQAAPTVATNFTGTVNLTMALLPLLLKSKESPRVVNVASRAGLLKILKSPDDHRKLFTNPKSLEALSKTMAEFVADVKANGTDNKFANTTYGMSKCGVIAWTGLMQRLSPTIGWSAMCPGYCNTSMSSGKGPRPAAEGAETASWLALSEDEAVFKSGGFFGEKKRLTW